MSQQISIHRALSLIQKAKSNLPTKKTLFGNNTLVGMVKGENQVPVSKGYKTKEELAKDIDSNFDQFFGNINLIVNIKQAISVSNNNTIVEFKGKQYTITQLLAYKELLSEYNQMIRNLASQIGTATDMSAKIDSDLTNKQNLSKEEMEAMLKVLQINTFSYHGQSPNEVLNEFKEFSEFMETEVNILLSEKNLATMIEIPD